MKVVSLLLLVSVIAFIVSSCAVSGRHNAEQLANRAAGTDQSPQIRIARAEPFALREFKPYLGDKWIGQAVSYGCYRKGQAPGVSGPSKAEILEDMKIMVEHWNLIRVYNADDDTQRILEVIREHNIPIKMMLGVWLENEAHSPAAKASNQRNVLRGIELTNEYPEIVLAINVGNETQVYWSWHKMEQEALIAYVRELRHHTRVPITTADDYNFWNKPESKAVADELDFIMTHIYPLWNGKTLDTAIAWLDSTFADVQKHHPDKLLVLGEIGWATAYNADKKGDGEQGTLVQGEVSYAAQAKFLQELDSWVRSKQITTFLFEAFDELWKGGGDDTGPNEIEKNWGVFYTDRSPKQSFSTYLKHKTQMKPQGEDK